MHKVSLSIIIAFALGLSGGFQSYSSASSETTIVGDIKATVINVSAPSKILFSIDPNQEEVENRFISADIAIINHSNAPIKVKIAKGRENFTLTEDSEWKPFNVKPDSFEWNNLGTSESESYIALGIKAEEGSWRKIERDSAFYVSEQNSSNQDVVFGEVKSQDRVNMKLICSHGLSFRERKQCTYRIIWSFGIGD